MSRLFFSCGLIIFIVLLLTINESVAQSVLFKTEETIKSIAVNVDGRLHILTDRSICQFEGSLKINDCIQLSQNKQSILVAIKDDHFIVAEGDIIKYYQQNKIIFTDTIPDIITAGIFSTGKVFFGTSGGLYSFSIDDLKWKVVFDNRFVNDICKGQGDTLFIATDDGIVIANTADKIIKNIASEDLINKVVSNQINEIIGLTNKGELVSWAMNGEEKRRVQLPPKPVIDMISSSGTLFFYFEDGIYTFKDGILTPFISGNFTDILVLDHSILLAVDKQVMHYDLTANVLLSNTNNYSIYSKPGDSYWIGKNKFIVEQKQDQELLRIGIPSVKKNLYVSSVVSNDNFIFAGTMGEGLYIFNKKGKLLKHLLSEEKNNRNNIIQLKLLENTLWIAYLNGIATLNASSLEFKKQYDDLLNNNYLYCALPINENHFYIGTSHNGLIEYNSGKLRTIVGNVSVYSLHKTNNWLFAGTEKSGVLQIADEEVKNVYPTGAVYSLMELDSTLLLINEKSQSSILDIKSQRQFPLDIKGLGNCQLNACSENAENVFVAYSNGIFIIDKKRTMRLRQIDLKLNNPRQSNEVIPSDKKTFSYRENSISFSYHLDEYFQNNKCNFKYRLLGLDSIWKTTEQNKVEFYNLTPGKYTFQVAYGFTSAFIPSNPKSFSFTINKPFWQTTWFYAITLAFILLGIYILFKIRERQIMQKQERKREQLALQLRQLKSQIDPHFLFNIFNSLMGLIEEDPKQAIEATEKISDLYRLILQLKDKNFVDIKTELNLAKLYMDFHKLRFENLINLNIETFETEGNVLPLSTQLLIENALKHNVINQANPLHISIKKIYNHLEIKNNINKKLSDKGSKSGYGLSNLKERYELLTDLPVLIEESSDSFIVKIPII